MPRPDIFDFDESDLANYDSERIDKVLIEQPALYMNHLRIARSLDAWANRLASGQFSTQPIDDDKYQQGYMRALQEIAAHLRQAEYVEGGYLLVESPTRPRQAD